MNKIETLQKIIAGLDEEIAAAESNDELGRTEKIKAINRLNEKKLKHQNAIERANADDQEAADLKAVYEEMKKFILDNDIHYIGEAGCYTKYHVEGGEWTNLRIEAIRTLHPDLADGEAREIFNRCLVELGRTKENVGCAFDELPDHTLNRMKKDHWLKPIECDEKDVHPLLRVLTKSLGGGKRENIEHIEKVLRWKYLHPEEFKLPALILFGEGGIGKNLLADVVWRQIVGKQSSSCGLEVVTGNFNQMLVAKHLVFLDEAKARPDEMDKIKSLIGNKFINVNEKYGPQYQAHNTALYITGGQADTSSIWLGGDESDRRWSICNAPIGKTYASWVCKCRELDLDGIDEAKDYITANERVFMNDTEVAKWLGWLVKKHAGDKFPPRALHGDDYQALVEAQSTPLDEVCDEIFGAKDFEWITSELFFNEYKRIAQRDAPSAKVAGKNLTIRKVQKILSTKYGDIEYGKINVANSSRRGFCKGGCSAKTEHELQQITTKYGFKFG